MAPGKQDNPSKHRMCDISSDSTLDPQMFVHDYDAIEPTIPH